MDAFVGFSVFCLLWQKHPVMGGSSLSLQVIFERALARFPVTSHLWLQYARFAESKLENIGVVNDIYKRAARNCPWVR
jgi:hypothetical protein